MERTYFLVNDTRYDNHHGCLTVVRNLHAAMASRGWTCTGSLPVSSSTRHLARYRRALDAAGLVIVNGEGSLHHDNRNTRRLFDIGTRLAKTHPIVLLNTIWQDNDAAQWKPLLGSFLAVYARDRRSQAQLKTLGVDARCAPDLTFYDVPRFPASPPSGFLCTDSVLTAWTEDALALCKTHEAMSYVPLFTPTLRHTRGPRDWGKRIKYRLYPWLGHALHVRVPVRYRGLPCAESDTSQLLARIASCRAICVARYHALCFALQQNVPFVAAASNSHKIEALIEEVGLPLEACLIARTDLPHLEDRLRAAIARHPSERETIDAFNRRAKEQIEQMFDHIGDIAP